MPSPRTGSTGVFVVAALCAACGTEARTNELARAEGAVTASPWRIVQASPPQLDGHTTTLVGDGKLLVLGGMTALEVASDRGFVLSFDPAKHQATAKLGGQLVAPRWVHTTTTLKDGKLLGAGGEALAVHASAELVDPVAGTSTATGSMREARARHAAALLASGKVLVVGGGTIGLGTSSELSSSELFDPATGTWSDGPSMLNGRAFATATTLSDGRVLVVGGTRKSTELYDPTTNTFERVGDLSEARLGHVAALLPSGNVLVAGGFVKPPPSAEVTRSAEIFDPATRAWTKIADMPTPRGNATATLLKNGLVMVAGGRVELTPLNYVDFYDEATGTWQSGSPMILPHALHTATPMGNGDVIVVGSANGELFSPIATGASCAQAADCESGFCVDGVCCATACAGGCERCDTSGARGTCAAVSGAINHCAAGDTCIQGACVPSAGTTCSADRLGVVDKDGNATSCAPFVCDHSVGACLTQCTTSVECAPGTLCDVATKQCAAPPAAADDGGCSASPGRATSEPGVLLVAVAIACAALFRARPSRTGSRASRRRSSAPARACSRS